MHSMLGSGKIYILNSFLPQSLEYLFYLAATCPAAQKASQSWNSCPVLVEMSNNQGKRAENAKQRQAVVPKDTMNRAKYLSNRFFEASRKKITDTHVFNL